jgi:TRAP-type mannitol/chloroaromatic compound transport system permease small subunit
VTCSRRAITAGQEKPIWTGEERGLYGLLGLSRAIDAVNYWIGKWVAWLVVAAVLVSAANATVRKVFDTSSNAWLELQWYLFALVFLLCASWTLMANEHVRIDIVNNLFSRRVRNWIDVFGHLFFLLPFTLVMIVTGWPFFLASWRVSEVSTNAGGLLVWPIKFLVPLAFLLLFFQGISELIKRIAVMRGLIPDPYVGSGSSLEAEAEELIKVLDKR